MPEEDADRRSAEYVLSVEGKFRINGQGGWLTSASDLPRGTFRLTSVDLGGNKRVTEAGLKAFRRTKHLYELGVQGCTGISDASLANFKENAGLAALNLQHTTVSPAGLRHFKDCSTLRWLYLGGSIKDEDMAFLKEFSWLRNLEDLELEGSEVTDDGLHVLEKHQKLNKLWLSNTTIGDAGLAHLRECRALERVWLERTRVTAEGVKELKRALPECKIIGAGADVALDRQATVPTPTVAAPATAPSPSPSEVALAVLPVAEKTVYPGEPDVVPVRIARNGYNGPVSVSLQGLPKDFKASTTTISAGQSRVLVDLEIPQDARTASAEVRVVASFENRSVDKTFTLAVRKRPPARPFEIALSGLGGQTSMKPISFGPDWLGFNKPLSPDAWKSPRNFARTATRAALGYPTIPVSRYVFETDLQILQPDKKLMICLGDPWVSVHLEFYWEKSRSKVGMKLMEWRYGGWGWNGGRLVDVGERLPLKCIVLDGHQVLCLKNKPILSVGSPWPSDFTLRVWSETPGSAWIHRCSCRELRQEDAELADAAMPEAELRLDVASGKARIEALRKGLPVRPANGKPFAAGRIRSPMAWIAPGEYWRGSTERLSSPRHRVKITQGFWMGRLEVTQEEFNTLMHANPSRVKGSPYLPVDWVTWQDAMAFCNKLNQTEAKSRRLPNGYLYRLPTDAEWEYACRAGSQDEFSVPATEVLWPEQSGRYPHQVGEKSANAWGLYDMHGNAMEWCLDGWHEYPKDTSTVLVNPYHSGDVNKGTFVVRGGAWWLPAWAAKNACRSCWREQNHSSPAGAYRGFRIALAPTLKPTAN